MKQYLIPLSLLWLTLFAGCLQNVVASERTQSRYEENRVKAIVFRDLISAESSAKSSNAPFLLAIRRSQGTVNPGRQVMRWVGYSKFVNGVSEMEGVCQQVRRHHRADAMGFLPGILFTIYGLKWIAKDRIDVIGSFRFNPCGHGDVGAYKRDLFHLKLDDKNNWVVVSKFQIVAAG